MKKILIYSTILCLVLGVYIYKANAINAKFQNVFKKAEPTKTSFSEKIVGTESSKIKEEDDQPEGNYIASNNVSISINHGQALQITNITPSTTLSAFGTPNSQSSEFSQDYNGDILTYNYNNVKIYFLNNALLGLDIEDEGASVDLKLTTGAILNKYIGSGGDDLYEIFNSSWANRTNNNLTLWIKTPTGEHTDGSIVFTLSGRDANVTSGNYVNRISIIN